MSGIRKRFLLASLAIAVTLTTAGVVVAAGTDSNKVSLDAAMINGEVYVKASSLVAEVGGTGTYD